MDDEEVDDAVDARDEIGVRRATDGEPPFRLPLAAPPRNERSCGSTCTEAGAGAEVRRSSCPAGRRSMRAISDFVRPSPRTGALLGSARCMNKNFERGVGVIICCVIAGRTRFFPLNHFKTHLNGQRGKKSTSRVILARGHDRQYIQMRELSYTGVPFPLWHFQCIRGISPISTEAGHSPYCLFLSTRPPRTLDLLLRG